MKNESELCKPRANILVIDDAPESLELLKRLLEKEGYTVQIISDPGLAYTTARDNLPDLILLDIMMPETDGYEVCGQLKADEQTRDIPVIFISALDETMDKVRAFSAGGVDYITKPFQRQEVMARVSAHLHIRNLQKQLEHANHTLEHRVMERTAELARVYEEKSEMQRQLQQAQKMEAIGTLAGGIAHDFNNILFTMIGYLEMLINELPENSRTCDWAEQVFKGAKRASELVEQILIFSRQSEHKQKPLRIYLVINEVLKLTRSTLPSTIQICKDIDKNCGLIMADPTQIHQIAMNLIINAYHAMQETGGTLKISLTGVTPGAEDLKYLNMDPGEYVCLTVEDTGMGMDRNVTDRIFDPYFTTKEKGKGTGLGLAVVHGIVKKYRGDIRVSSEPGKGSVFQVYLPKIEKKDDTESLEPLESVQRGNERILLVDDEEELVAMEGQLLKDLGYHVITRTCSIDALEVFKAAPDQFDLVITDLTMPNMTGIKLSQELIQIRPDIPVILCSGFTENISRQAIKSLGIREYVRKPVFRSQLAKIIREVLDY